MSERSARHLFERFDTGPISAALNATLPTRGLGVSASQRGDLINETGGMLDQIRSSLSRSIRTPTSLPQVPSTSFQPVSGQVPSYNTGSAYQVPTYQSASTGSSYARLPTSSSLLGEWSTPTQRTMQTARDTIAAKLAAQQQQSQAPGGDPGGMGNPTGGNWDKVNQWNSLIQNAIQRVSSETGITVPANIIKAVMELESGGVNVGCNQWGYCGLMQTGPGSNISNFNAAYNATPEGNIYYGTQELANWYRAIGTGNWVDAAAAYFSGYNYNRPGVSDGYGTTVAQYRARIEQNLAVLNSAGGGSWSGGGGGSLATSFGNYWTQNQSDFGVTSSNGLYDYGRQYGLNGVQHTGEDIMMPLGTTFYAPADATVVCVGCWRNDHITGGVGRIELLMPDGARVLFDHSNQSFVQVGQKVKAGQPLGTSGGMYSPHIHLEVRVPDSSTPSGQRLVDPAAYFAGYVGGGGTNAQFQQVPRTATQRLLQLMGRSF